LDAESLAAQIFERFDAFSNDELARQLAISRGETTEFHARHGGADSAARGCPDESGTTGCERRHHDLPAACLQDSDIDAVFVKQASFDANP
jgi:hypothetical protein